MSKNSKKEKPAVVADTPRSAVAIAVCLGVVALLTVADLWSKHWAEEALSADRYGEAPPVCQPDEYGRIVMQRVRTEPVVVIDGLLEMRYAENCGAAFGLLQSAPPVLRALVFGVAATLASIALFVMFVRGRGAPLFAASVPMIISGAIGNLVDRVRYGYVVDFVRMHNLPLIEEWPTFNIADIGITVGVVLLLLDGLKEGKKPEQTSAKDGSSSKTAQPE